MATVSVDIPTPYREVAGKEARISAEANSLGKLLATIADRFPGLKDRIYHDGVIAPHLNIYINGEEMHSLNGLDTALTEGDRVALVPAVAGGVDWDDLAESDGAPLLSDEQMERYSRHTRLSEVGVEGQRKLLDAKVLIVGAGGLGSPAALYLAAAGVGTIGLIDGDRVDRSNLQRQILHDESWIGKLKVDSAKARLEKLNPDVLVETYPVVLNSANALDIVDKYDLVVNGCDNFPTRYLLNDACVLSGKPLIDAGIMSFYGQATVYYPGRGCYRCLFPTPPPPGSVPNCAEVGIIGALAGQFGTLQAMQAVKLILGIGELLTNKLYLYNALEEESHLFNWEKREKCPVCGENPTITELIDYEEFCGVPAPSEAEKQDQEEDISLEYDLAAPQARQLVQDGARIIDVREEREYKRQYIPGSILIPLAKLTEQLEELDPEEQILFVCQIGERSGKAVRALRDAGFYNTYNLAGGIIAWVNHRYPTAGAKKEELV
jgi:sulfur-carrier protein adenylyltransferase/sulfurtransferase